MFDKSWIRYSSIIFWQLSSQGYAQTPFESVYGNESFISIATGNRQSTKEAPAIVTVIEREQIENSSAQTFEEILETVAGIHVSYSNGGYTPIFNIRGITSSFNSQALVMINDIPVTHLYNGDTGVGWSHMPLSVIEKIEVVRGPGSVLYGADAYTGVINIITKSSQSQSSTLKATAGSYDTVSLAGTHSALKGHWDITSTFDIGRTEGFDSIVESDQQTVFDAITGTNASHAPGPVQAGKKWLDFWSQASTDAWTVDIGYQGRYDQEMVIGWFGALDNYGSQDSHRLFLSAKHEKTLDNEATVEQHASALLSKLNTSIQLLPPGAQLPGASDDFPNGIISDIGYRQVMTRYNFAYNFSLTEKHLLRFGLNTYIGRLSDIHEYKNFDASFAPLPNDSFVYLNGTDPGIFIRPATRKNIALYAQDEYSYSDRATFTFGVRYDYYNDFGSTFNPRAALVHTFSDMVTGKILYGTAFLAPSLFELSAINNPVLIGNPNLEPDTIRTLEGSLIFQLDTDETLSINAYQNTRSDIIEVASGTATYENAGSQVTRGLELEYFNQITPFWLFRGNMAIVQSSDQNSNTDAPFVPQRQLYLSNTWQVNSEFTVSFENNFVADRQRAASDSRPALGDDLESNLAMTFDPVNEDYSIKVSITNLFDADIREPTNFSPAGSAGVYYPQNDLPMPDRQIFAELQIQL